MQPGSGRPLALAKVGYAIAALDVAKPLAYPGYALGTTDELATLAEECGRLGVACLTFAADVYGWMISLSVDMMCFTVTPVDLR